MCSFTNIQANCSGCWHVSCNLEVLMPMRARKGARKVNRLRLLVADDDPDLLEICVQVLEMEGYRVDIAHDGSEALRKLYKNGLDGVDGVDGILLDIMMPGVDGLTLCKTIRHDPRIKEVPIIFMSASHMARQQAKICGDAVLAKPFDLDLLVDTLHQFV